MMLLLRSQLQNILMYVTMLIYGLVFAIPSLFSENAAYYGIKAYARLNRHLLRIICGVRAEIRGEIPDEPCLVCAKHASFLDILMLCEALPRMSFIMKAELRYVPVIGFYASRIGAAPVRRGDKRKAVSKMLADLAASPRDRQLVIFPQGTRVLPNQKLPYKKGAAAIYQSFGMKTYLVATNIGVLWERKSAYRYPGLAVVEFLSEPLDAGIEPGKFMKIMEERIETRSDELMEEYPRGYVG